MDNLNHSAVFQKLLELEIITPALRDKALNHPKLPELDGYSDDVAHALMWMILKDVYSEEEFNAKIEADEEQSWLCSPNDERVAIIDEVKQMLQSVKISLNQQSIKALFDEGLIDKDTLGIALNQLPSTQVLASPAAALAWLMMSKIASEEDVQSTLTRKNINEGKDATSKACAIFSESKEILFQIGSATVNAEMKAAWLGMLPSPPWMFAGAGIAIVAGLYFQRPSLVIMGGISLFVTTLVWRLVWKAGEINA